MGVGIGKRRSGKGSGSGSVLELPFALLDSARFRSFCDIGVGESYCT